MHLQLKKIINARQLFNNGVVLYVSSRLNHTNVSQKAVNNRQLIISCKRKRFNFYTDTTYKKFDEEILASQGWAHNKSKGDHFIIHPNPNESYEETIPFNEISTIHPSLIKALSEQGIQHATSFQQDAVLTLMDNRHTLLAAETGCGKTISYLIPIIQKLMDNKQTKLNTPRALILIPTRELAQQVGEMAKSLAEPVGLKVKTIVGGRTKRIMLNPEFDEIDLLVATPGVVGKLSTVGIYRLGEVQHTVLDEADSLTDDSFIERMSTLLYRVTQSQIILVSATIPKSLPDCLKPIESGLVHVISPRVHKPLMNITQKFMRITRSARPAELLTIAKESTQPLMIFTNKNKSCDWIAMFLRENGLSCANINGEMASWFRIEQWRDFSSGRANILSATDIASRGLNTTKVRHVINYDFPAYMADYIHRIGRTGRFGSPEACKVTNFVSANDVKLVQQIEVTIMTNYCRKIMPKFMLLKLCIIAK